jgi:hypothetical protein
VLLGRRRSPRWIWRGKKQVVAGLLGSGQIRLVLSSEFLQVARGGGWG